MKMKTFITPFRHRVLLKLCEVPCGKVTTYKAIANQLNCGSCQAIGQALKNNPYAPLVPCHRVIQSDFSIGGFHGQTSGMYIRKKIKLLHNEGIQFEFEYDDDDNQNQNQDKSCDDDDDDDHVTARKNKTSHNNKTNNRSRNRNRIIRVRPEYIYEFKDDEEGS